MSGRNNLIKLYYVLEQASRSIAEKGAQAFEKLEPRIKPYTRGETVDYGAIPRGRAARPSLLQPRQPISIKPSRQSAARREAAARPQVADGSNRHEKSGEEASSRPAPGGRGQARRGDRRVVSSERSARQHSDLRGRPGTAADEARGEAQARAIRLITYTVERTTNVPPSSTGVHSCLVTPSLSTTANRGPCLISAISASIPAGGPRTSASTAPSDRLRTQPETFSLSAARRVNSRYPTPFTAPSTTRRQTRIDVSGAVIVEALRNACRQVWHATKRRRS